jgi:hypothetical protein
VEVEVEVEVKSGGGGGGSGGDLRGKDKRKCQSDWVSVTLEGLPVLCLSLYQVRQDKEKKSCDVFFGSDSSVIVIDLCTRQWSYQNPLIIIP